MIWSVFLPNLFVILTVFLFLLPSVRSLLIYSFLCGVSYKSWKLSECRTEPHLKLADLSSPRFTSPKHDWGSFKDGEKEAIHWEREKEMWRLKDDRFGELRVSVSVASSLKYTLSTTHTISAWRPWTAEQTLSVLFDLIVFRCVWFFLCTILRLSATKSSLCGWPLHWAELWLAESSELTRDWSGRFSGVKRGSMLN